MKGATLCIVVLVVLCALQTDSSKLRKTVKRKVARKRSLDHVTQSMIKKNSNLLVPSLKAKAGVDRKKPASKAKSRKKPRGSKAKKIKQKNQPSKRIKSTAKIKSSPENLIDVTPKYLELKSAKVVAKSIPKELSEEIIRKRQKRGCAKCIWQECPSVNAMKKYCPSGVTRDKCGCCAQCASSVGMRCYLTEDEQEWLPPCGDDLECVPALEGSDIGSNIQTVWGTRVASEGVCSCTESSPVCGSDDVTYDNICEFREAVIRTVVLNIANISVSHRGPCRTAPKIDSPPVDVSELEGNVVSFRCETSGFPLPRVQWIKKSVNMRNEKNEELPGYLSHAVTQMRGGPGRYQLTTWLTLDRAKETDSGIYICRSSNRYGVANGQAALRIKAK